MVNRLSIELIKSNSTIDVPVSKFGGQPVWLTKNEWPVSKSTGYPLKFLCQIVLDQRVFEHAKNKIAYLFLEEDLCPNWLPYWKPVKQDSALIIQSGIYNAENSTNGNDGPTITSTEYIVELTETNDPNRLEETIVEEYHQKKNWHKIRQYNESLEGNKLGGTPFFDRSYTYPSTANTTLLLQIDPTNLPFELKLGKFGMLYAFLSSSYDKGEIFWKSMIRSGCYGIINQGNRDILIGELQDIQNQIKLHAHLNRSDLYKEIKKNVLHWARPIDSSDEIINTIERLEKMNIISIPTKIGDDYSVKLCQSCGEEMQFTLIDLNLCATCTQLEHLDRKINKWSKRMEQVFQGLIDGEPIFSGAEKTVRTEMLSLNTEKIYKKCDISEYPIYKPETTAFLNELLNLKNPQ
jgi:hypothetical protein